MEGRPNDLREPEGGHMRRVKEIVRRERENFRESWRILPSFGLFMTQKTPCFGDLS